MDEAFDPEKYNMVFCPVCNGRGRLPKQPKGFDVCGKCGGFGFVKNESVENVNSSQEIGGERRRSMTIKI